MNSRENVTSRVLGITIVALVLLFWLRGAIVATLIRSDLQDCGQAVRRAEITLADKERLLDRIEFIEDRLNQGDPLGYLRWRRTASVIQGMLEDGIHGDEARLLERELDRVENLLRKE
jgi:hypothetical protein